MEKNLATKQIVIGGIKSGQVNRKSWNEKVRNVDVFDIKSDAVRTLIELGLDEKNLFISDSTKASYHPGRSGSINLMSEKGPHLAYFGELHPSIIKNLDYKEKNIFGFEIFLKNIPQPNKKIRQTKPNYKVSDFQKSERDFAFIIDKNFKVQELVKIISEIDEKLIRNVKIFDLYQGENIPGDKKSVALSVTIQSLDKSLNDQDLEKINNLIISTVETKSGAKIRS